MKNGVRSVVIPEDGVVRGLEGLLRLPPFMRSKALSLATDEEFLQLEPDLIAEGEFWPGLCCDQRRRRGL